MCDQCDMLSGPIPFGPSMNFKMTGEKPHPSAPRRARGPPLFEAFTQKALSVRLPRILQCKVLVWFISKSTNLQALKSPNSVVCGVSPLHNARKRNIISIYV